MNGWPVAPSLIVGESMLVQPGTTRRKHGRDTEEQAAMAIEKGESSAEGGLRLTS